MSLDIQIVTEIDADDDVRGMTLLNENGDLEITWEKQNDEKMRALIQKKMEEGVRFFIMKPLVGDVLHMRRKITKVSELKEMKVKVKDADIETMFTQGDVAFVRTHGEIETIGVASVKDKNGKQNHYESSKVAVKNRTAGIRALSGG